MPFLVGDDDAFDHEGCCCHKQNVQQPQSVPYDHELHDTVVSLRQQVMDLQRQLRTLAQFVGMVCPDKIVCKTCDGGGKAPTPGGRRMVQCYECAGLGFLPKKSW